MFFLLTKKNAARIEQSEISILEDRLQALEAMEGNPMGVEMRRFGHAVAFSVKHIPGPSYNVVKGVRPGSSEDIASIIQFYEEKEIPARFDVTPSYATEELLKSLHEKGYFQSGFHTSLYLASEEVPMNQETHPSIQVEELQRKDFALFGSIYTRGFQMPDFLMDHVTNNNKILLDRGSWTFYLASINGEPAGIGVLFVKDGVGTLAASTTLP